MCHLHGWERAVREEFEIEKTEKDFRVSEHTGRREEPIRQNAMAAGMQSSGVTPNCRPDRKNARSTHDM